nr:MAG TPA: hypothetical protein [Caudoviricetes sp.]
MNVNRYDKFTKIYTKHNFYKLTLWHFFQNAFPVHRTQFCR